MPNLGAQTSSFIDYSEAIDRGNTPKPHALLHNDSTGFYFLRFNNKKNIGEIEHYDTLMQHQGTYRVTDKERRYVGIINIEGDMYILYFHYVENKKDDTFDDVSLYAKGIDLGNFELKKDSITLIPPFKMQSNFYRGNFAVSPDRSKILVFDYEEEGDIEGVPGLTDDIHLRVFDQEFNMLWERQVNLAPAEHVKRVVALKKLRINNDGEVGILTDIFDDVRSYDERYVTASPTLFFVGKEKRNFSRFTPNMKDYFFNEIDFTFDQEGNVLWFGFYSQDKYYQQAGTFFIKINAERNKIISKNIQPLEMELLEEMVGKKKAHKGIEPRSFKMVYWQRMDDGGIALTLEHQPPSVQVTKTHSVVVIRYDSLGNQMWARYFYKHGRQGKGKEQFLSHYFTSDGEYIYLLFNDGIYGTNKAQAIRLNAEGKMRKRTIASYDTQQELLCPKLSFPVGEEKLFLYFEDSFMRRHKIGLLDLKALFKSS